MTTLKIKKYIANPSEVEAIQITSGNIHEVAKWCGGDVRKSDTDKTVKFIKVPVFRALSDKQTKGYSGDWILKRGTSFKVYTDVAFKKNFTDGEAVKMVPDSEQEGVSEVIFQSMVEAREKPQETRLMMGGHESKFSTPPAGVPMRGVIFQGQHYDNASDIPVRDVPQQ